MSKIIKKLSAKIDRLEMGNRNQNKPMPEGDRNQTQFRRPFPLGFFQGKDKIMIYRDTDEKMKNKGFNLLFKKIMSEMMNHMKLMKES